VGLKDLVARTPQEYVAIATRLAMEGQRSSQLRLNLRKQMMASPLMDARNFALAVESAYRRMWSRWCEQSQARG
jgi:predicted O-linked N-acetylglucosamine transferase (SPINDLY family)